MKIIIKKLSELAQFVEVEDGLLNVLNGCTVRVYDGKAIDGLEGITGSADSAPSNNEITDEKCIKALELTFQHQNSQSEGKTFILQDLQIEKFVLAMIYQSEQLAIETI